MNGIPNPLAEPSTLISILDIPSIELLKIAVIGMIGTGLLVIWLEKKINKLGELK